MIKIGKYLLIALIPCLALSSVVKTSPTCDEPWYLFRGYSSLVTGELDVGHVDWGIKLNERIAGLSVLLFHRPQYPPEKLLTKDDNDWLSRQAPAFVTSTNNPQLMMFWARLPFVVMSMLMGAFVFYVAKRFYGERSALLALFLYVLCPNILAHSSLCSADFTPTVTMFLTTYLFLRYLETRSKKLLWMCGVALALALLSKETLIILLPAFAFMMVVNYLLTNKESRSRVRVALLRGAAAYCVILVIAVLTIWAAYQFETRPLLEPGREHDTFKRLSLAGPLKGVMPRDRIVSAYGDVTALLERVNVPAPSFWRSVRAKAFHAGGDWQGFPSYLMGQYSNYGWRYYFPIAFLVKVPLALTALFLVSLAMILLRPHGRFKRELLFLIPPAILFAAAMTSSVNIGFRHILPIMPFVIVIASRVLAERHAAEVSLSRQASTVLVAALGGWFALASFGIYPNYLAYFNEVAGGPEGGIAWLADSNLEWGQDLPALASYMDKHGIKNVHLSYFGNVDPQAYGVRLVNGQQFTSKDPNSRYFRLRVNYVPRSGYIAVSATNLKCVFFEDKHALTWLNEKKPVAKIGYSIYLYNLGQGQTSPAQISYAPERGSVARSPDDK